MRRPPIGVVVWCLSLLLASSAYATTTSQNPHGTLRWDCADCHTSDSWSHLPDSLVFQHDETGYPLIGAHKDATCRGCHSNLRFETVSNACADCHTDVHQGQLSAACENCHVPRDWRLQEDVLSTHAERGFPLTGVHAATDCDACHGSSEPREFATAPIECGACHLADYQSPSDPDHEAAGFALDCQQCHTDGTVSWSGATYTHPEAFPLTDAHAEQPCVSCHAGEYTNTDPECYACHQTAFETAADPDHVTGDYDHNCAACHSEVAWAPADYDHEQSRFALTGAHTEVVCADCHASGFTGTPLECYACHEDAFADAEDPDHVAGEFNHDCAICHTPEAWAPATIDHSLTDFPLTGAHVATDCNQCHTSGYANTSSECYACHASAFAATTDPNHVNGNFDHDCMTCHTTEAWKPATFDHNQTGFALTGAHASTTCESCHADGFSGTSLECFACHEDNFVSADDPDHEGGQYDHDCGACHSTADWRPAEFDHTLASFPLTGAHTSVACDGCHTSGYTGTPAACMDCHSGDFTSVDDPDHVNGGYDNDCTACHTTAAWMPADFNHDQTRFPLTGAHVGPSCDRCHATQFTGTAFECIACHEEDFAGTVDPDHVGSQFPPQCEICHATTAWAPSHINHDLTGFPLTGAHQSAACESCHPNGYTGTSRDCFACHDDDYAAVSDPDHAGGNYSHACDDCHSTLAWTPAEFDHAATQFPLTGAHTDALCDNCHQSGYTGTALECFACHSDDFASALDPDHAGGDLPHECQNCHTTAAWTPADFNHADTQFPLVGAHASVLCQDCHTAGYTATPTDCIACHDDDFAGVADPDHVGGSYDPDCTACHTMVAWRPATIDHNTTDFPLTGAHESVTCNSCHAAGFTGTLVACDACHHDDYLATTDPNHATAEFSTECEACHTTDGWRPATLDHDLTAFPLTGAHQAVACTECHTSGYTGTPSDCYACHSSEFTATDDPNHELAAFDHDCTVCHTTVGWTPANWDHDQTQFPLTGAHEAVTCASCHTAQYAGTSMDCIACHDDDFNATVDPDHVGGNYSHTCTMCHTTIAWTPAEIDHNLTDFPLTGAHQAVACNSCHTDGYTGTPLDCYSCHTDDFASTDEPNHPLAAFDHDCTICHTTAGWTPANWDHASTQFPLTGAHTGVTCNSCHAEGYVGTPVECYACHEEDFAAADDPDHVGGNYSHECTVCHTTTAWEPAEINHDLTQFPLTGAHQAVACNDCHVTGYSGTPLECYSCHADVYSATDDPNHELAGFDHNCTICHQTTSWEPANWDHDQTAFALTGAHVDATCTSCHATGFAGTPIECFACHESDFAGVADPDHEAGGFDHDCTLCHSTDAWVPGGIDHDQTQFPLTGAHIAVACNLCHTAGYTGTPLECYACHEDDFVTVNDPDHVTGNYSHECTICHTTDAWEPAEVDHDLTQFPLTGAHIAVACNLCHTAGYTGTPLDCYACHESDFSSVDDPDHVTGNYSHECTICHTTDAWEPAEVNHDQTQFPLTGAHLAVACDLCHSTGYTNTSMECFACHEDDFLATLDPDHSTGGYDHVCSICHSTDAWTPADIDHNLTNFPLTGAHTGATCTQCHSAGYTGTSILCLACHESDYNSTNDPDHTAAGFPTTCEDCHSTIAWEPADWDHDLQYFPIYSGRHNDRWTVCADCHVVPGDYAAFECILCHEHSQSETDSHHQEVSGYVWESTACLNCHPDGEAGD